MPDSQDSIMRRIFIIQFACGFLMGSLAPIHSAEYELTAEQRKIPLEADVSGSAKAKIVLLAGSPSNKPGQHEYFAGCALMAHCLTQTTGVATVMVANGWPENEGILDGAASVVLYMDGGAKFAALPRERWDRLKRLMADGTGLVVLHQAVDIPAGQATEFQSWLGGVWQADRGSRGHWDMSFSDLPSHEILRGVQPFSAPKDGWLFNLNFAAKGVTPILGGAVPDKARTTADAKGHTGRAEVVAWAYERAGGGRSFAFTGCDLHQNWEQESQRRLVVNGILWTAGIGVPDGGAPVACEAGLLKANLDRKVFLKPASTAVPKR